MVCKTSSDSPFCQLPPDAISPAIEHAIELDLNRGPALPGHAFHEELDHDRALDRGLHEGTAGGEWSDVMY